MITRADKQQLLKQIETRLGEELATLMVSAQAAAEAATHEESKPENEYDTRGLEASYLAGAQRERVADLETALQRVRAMVLRDFTSESAVVAPTAVVEVIVDDERALYFLLAVGAGFPLRWQGQRVTVITPQSPLGKALAGKSVGDIAAVRVGNGADEKEYEIVSLY